MYASSRIILAGLRWLYVLTRVHRAHCTQVGSWTQRLQSLQPCGAVLPWRGITSVINRLPQTALVVLGGVEWQLTRKVMPTTRKAPSLVHTSDGQTHANTQRFIVSRTRPCQQQRMHKFLVGMRSEPEDQLKKKGAHVIYCRIEFCSRKIITELRYADRCILTVFSFEISVSLTETETSRWMSRCLISSVGVV